ncbi:MAG: single-stranded DNA-binding protein [Colwellia sp.]|nr:single-stranded DNA-binding protein [Colwellia sp.]
MSVNSVILVGNIVRDPEIRKMSSGDSLCNLTVATSDRWKDKQTGERKEKSEFHRVVIFNEHIVKVCENYLKKGSKVYIQGSLQTRKWTDQSGVEKYSTEIILQKFKGELQMLDSRGGESSGAPRGADPSFATKAEIDDEIPF